MRINKIQKDLKKRKILRFHLHIKNSLFFFHFDKEIVAFHYVKLNLIEVKKNRKIEKDRKLMEGKIDLAIIKLDRNTS